MKPHEAPESENRPKPPATRKTYQRPQLQVYGDLGELTQANVGTMSSDGAGHPNKHFTS
jgi:hypothetical protein